MRTTGDATQKNALEQASGELGQTAGGLKFSRVLTRAGSHPYEELKWEKRTAAITNDKGEKIFELDDVEMPATWSQMATNVVVSKYFRSQS